MQQEKITDAISGKILRRDELFALRRRENPNLTQNTFSWQLAEEIRLGTLQHLGRNTYRVNDMNTAYPMKKYNYPSSREIEELTKLIREAYPFAEFQIWESAQYNEFLNHLLAKNIIFVESEKMLVESIYETLRKAEKYHVLVAPTLNEMKRYVDNNTIILTKLTTQSPKNKDDSTQPPLEKLLTDLYANRYLKCSISIDEYSQVFNRALTTYQISFPRLKRYAQRRNVYDKILPYLFPEAGEI